MAALTIFTSLVLFLILIINIEAAVIKMQEIPITKDVTIKIVVKEDSEGTAIASIKIGMDDKKHNKVSGLLPKLLDKFVKPSSDFVPDMNGRNGIVNGNCPIGKVRRGPICTIP